MNQIDCTVFQIESLNLIHRITVGWENVRLKLYLLEIPEDIRVDEPATVYLKETDVNVSTYPNCELIGFNQLTGTIDRIQPGEWFTELGIVCGNRQIVSIVPVLDHNQAPFSINQTVCVRISPYHITIGGSISEQAI